MATRLQTDLKPNVTPDQVVEMALELFRMKRALDEANGKYRAQRKKMDSAGIDMKAFAMLESLSKLDEEERCTRLRNLFRLAAPLDLKLAKQADLFPETVEVPGEKMTAEQRKWAVSEAGYEAGKKGANRDSNPNEAGSEYHATWDEGWIRGQATIADRMAPERATRTGAARRAAGARRRNQA